MRDGVGSFPLKTHFLTDLKGSRKTRESEILDFRKRKKILVTVHRSVFPFACSSPLADVDGVANPPVYNYFVSIMCKL
ncbi:hypothetical protein Csa_018887 [Cucumis sativus]|uniref:Uncharacterized protein n=1 Tax=Cucumis sativus TaxID=3659 RepID=A0A0A0KWI5_CUCSA|nr:hypothetical protein Csa_018887 [Cucumis sativus]